MKASSRATLLIFSALLVAIVLMGCQTLGTERKLRITPRVIRDGYLIHPKHEPISCSDAQAKEFYGIHWSDMDKIIELTEEK